jgi:5-methylcytosine-specific restriction endonuclease McrA
MRCALDLSTRGLETMLKKVKRIKLGKQVYRRLMKKVLERDGWRCRKCGSLEDLQVHHKIRRSQQGNDSLDNLVTLCAYCHMAEHGQLSYDSAAMHAVKETPERRRQQSNSSVWL